MPGCRGARCVSELELGGPSPASHATLPSSPPLFPPPSLLPHAAAGNHSEEQRKAAYLYGTYVGQAFQLIDDALDFEGTLSTTGKAPLADLQSGLATAPTLFAAEEFPKLAVLIARKFESPGDVDEALALVNRSQGVLRCKQLAQVHAEKAIEAVQAIGPSAARDALVALAAKVVTRTH